MAATMTLSSPVSGTLAGDRPARGLLGNHISGERFALRRHVQQPAVQKRWTGVLRAKPIAEMQVDEREGSAGISSAAKKVTIAAAAVVLLSMPTANVSSAFAATDSASDILTSAKKAADDAGAKFFGEAPPPSGQRGSSSEKMAVPKGDQIVARPEFANTTAPGTGKQEELTNTRPTSGESIAE